MTPLRRAHDARRYGGKAASLASALERGLPVPDGFALDVEATSQVADGASLAWPRDERWAVRSSAVGEDGEHASFAGLHVTRLNVRGEHVDAAVREVHASARSEAALGYRRRLGLPETPRMAVVVQRMVRAEVAGVLFTRCPTTGADVRVIEASWGLGEVVVSGLVTPDHFRVSREGRVQGWQLGEKDVALAWTEEGGTHEVEVPPEQRLVACLSPERLDALHQLARAIEACEDGPHDVEWAFERGATTPVLLQRRAITR